MKVYVVEVGQYSDQYIHSVWATHEDAMIVADSIRNKRAWREDVCITEYAVGEKADKARCFFRVIVNADGSVDATWPNGTATEADVEGVTFQGVPADRDDCYLFATTGQWGVDVIAPDEATAHKIAFDRITAAKAHKEGIS